MAEPVTHQLKLREPEMIKGQLGEVQTNPAIKLKIDDSTLRVLREAENLREIATGATGGGTAKAFGERENLHGTVLEYAARGETGQSEWALKVSEMSTAERATYWKDKGTPSECLAQWQQKQIDNFAKIPPRTKTEMIKIFKSFGLEMNATTQNYDWAEVFTKMLPGGAVDADHIVKLAQVNEWNPDNQALQWILGMYGKTAGAEMLGRIKGKKGSSTEATKRERPIQNAEKSNAKKETNSSDVKSGGFSDVGTDMVNHPVNQDRFKISNNEQFTFAVLADGVGSYESSDKTAQIAVDTIADTLQTQDEINSGVITDVVHLASTRNTTDGDTTLAIAALGKDRVLRYANLGDSVIYVYEPNRGLVIASQVENMGGDHANVISNSLRQLNGINYAEHVVPPGGKVLMVTDGVANKLNLGEIQDLVRANMNKTPTEISALIVQAAKGKPGGCENVSAVCLQ